MNGKLKSRQPLLILMFVILLAANIALTAGLFPVKQTGTHEAGSKDKQSVSSGSNQLSDDSAIDKTLISITAEPAYAVYVSDSIVPPLELVPSTAETKLTFESLSPEIAEINENGSVTGISEGRAVINVFGTPDVSATFEIVVKKKMPDPAKDYPPLYDEKVQVVNAWNPLSEDYEPEVVEAKGHAPAKASSLSMTQEALDNYVQMYNDCKEATGKKIYLITAYRSYSTQNYIFNQSVNKYKDQGYDTASAKKLASNSIQPPGSSEHQLGTSIDIGDTLEVSGSFAKTKQGIWLSEHAHEYGWILRYPSDKTEITGISYEAWHFRYVGREHAEYIHSHNLCLEEYVKLQEEAAINAIEYCRDHPATCD